jgi:isoquinoline 1-oxidoreductase subunit beta
MASKLKLPAVNRRKFLIRTGVGAGLVIGYLAWPRERALNWAARPGETVVNGWVKIDSSGRVIVAVPQAEMGQGVYTALPQLVADELGADWRTVGVEPAPLHPVYANTFMSQAAAEGLPSLLQGLGRWALVELAQRYALQLTGGSTSVMAYYDTLRLAGASARALLCKAAAERWDVDWTECDTANGFVEHGGKRLRFAEIIDEVDPDDAPEEPKLRAAPRYLGRSVPRLDIPGKVDGSARFGVDVRLPDMAYAAVRGGPIDGAGLASVDDAAAKRRPGVIGVVEGPTWVAAVADTWWGARTALDAVKSTFDKPAAVASSPAIARALGAALAGDEAEAFRDDGDALEALGAGSVVQATYGVPFLAHACLEPMTATARIVDGRCEIWTPTQSATLVNWRVADALGISEDDVTVFPTLLGGGFGRKAEVDACVQAALIARDVGRPVQLIWTREEDTAQDKYRPAARARMRARIGPDKRIVAWHSRIAVPSVGPSFMSRNVPSLGGGGGANAQALEGALDLPYDLAAVRVEHAPVETPVPLGFWRSVGHSYTAFFVESFVDELAAAAGVDPLTFRLRMLGKSPRHAEVLRVAAAEAGFMGASGDGSAQGIALHESFGSIVAQVAEVAIKDGTLQVTRVTCAIDCGRIVNPDIVRQQMEGGIIFGLSAALHGAITFAGGRAEQSNFDSYPLLSMAETPEIDVHIITSNEAPGGVGEPGVPPIAPALANAVFAATGVRVRDLPFAGKTLA